MKFYEFNVLPNLPDNLKPLLDISYNIWWAWDSETFALFRDIDPELWSETVHNPVKFLYRLPQEKLNALSKDESILYRIENIKQRLNNYLKKPTYFDKIKSNLPENFLIAYFSLEYGIAECLPLYSGGLGVLAGDHLKSASDLGLPLVGIGLLYSSGYFHQYLTNDGWQQERYIINDYNLSPVTIVKKDDKPLIFDIKYPHGTVKVMVWQLIVGRVKLYLLDTNIPENSNGDREITSKLYGGDLELRIKQEILLGIGGMMALELMGLTPTVTHMNEGHSAFLSLERIRLLMEKHKLTFNEAKEINIASSVFTTHTPVPAGNDRFPKELMEKYLKEYVEQNLKINFNEFLKLGKIYPDDPNEWFCMTVLALKLSAYNNGVSRLHGKISRKMWKDIWPGVPLHEIPITHITNGVHGASWISKEMADLFYRYLGSKWADNPEDAQIWKRVFEIPDTELWGTHERRRERLVEYVRRKLKKQLIARNAPSEEINRVNEIFSPEALTIGFARRFATYKRATLIFQDIERLKRILSNKDMPVQIIFAGKAHPKDDAGKDFIKQIYHIANKEEFKDKIVFIEDYDLNASHYLVQGVDLWLNNPRRPLEASGTSGMKVNFNGGLNFSVLDGWWDEKPNAECGWDIGRGEEYEDHEYQDKLEANSLYETLESEIIPLFYKRGKDGLPHEWIKKMKNAIYYLCPIFNTNRMVIEYTENFYKKAAINFIDLSDNDFQKARELNKWKEKIIKNWQNVKIISVNSNARDIKIGNKVDIFATIEAPGLSRDDLLVEIYFGYDHVEKELSDISTIKMSYIENNGNNMIFKGQIEPKYSGKIKFAVRILPFHPDLKIKFIPGFIKWNDN
ncbi:MAG: alpha-glucan family phosphorylase [Candidatus Goldbacteria bacterium]|nr:alpha-glucan family phosphorylase [Candidatus Goldiibacteriota bacterium]